MLCDLAERAASKLEELLTSAKIEIAGMPDLPEAEIAVFGDGVLVLEELVGSLRTVSKRIQEKIKDSQVH